MKLTVFAVRGAAGGGGVKETPRILLVQLERVGTFAETEELGRTHLFSVIVPTFMSVRLKF